MDSRSPLSLLCAPTWYSNSSSGVRFGGGGGGGMSSSRSYGSRPILPSESGLYCYPKPGASAHALLRQSGDLWGDVRVVKIVEVDVPCRMSSGCSNVTSIPSGSTCRVACSNGSADVVLPVSHRSSPQFGLVLVRVVRHERGHRLGW